MPVTVVGPDKQTYQFPDGTDKTAAIAYFKKKGIGKLSEGGKSGDWRDPRLLFGPRSRTPPFMRSRMFSGTSALILWEPSCIRLKPLRGWGA